MKLSIIVPVYNVKKTLRRCVDSITSQDFRNFELLLVDDGSTDNSGLLADEMAQNDARLTVFHKSNGGLSDARNYGLDRAEGEYITFVDSDDELAPGTLGKLIVILDAHKDYDILEYPVLENPGRDDEHLFNPGINEYADAPDWLSEQGLTHCWACNKIYKRWVFNSIRFPFGRKYEDMLTMGSIIKKRPFIATTDKGMYIYHWNGDSITAKERQKGLQTLLETQIEVVKGLGIDTRYRRWHRLYMDMFTIQLHAYCSSGRILLQPQRVSLRCYRSPKEFVKTLMLNILGLKTACRLFKLIHNS